MQNESKLSSSSLEGLDADALARVLQSGTERLRNQVVVARRASDAKEARINELAADVARLTTELALSQKRQADLLIDLHSIREQARQAEALIEKAERAAQQSREASAGVFRQIVRNVGKKFGRTIFPPDVS